MRIKAYNNKPGCLLFSVILIFAVHTYLSAQEARKEYAERYDVSKGITLSSETSYSDIELLSWDQDVMDILVVVEVDAGSRSRAEEALEKVHVDINKSGNRVTLETAIESGWRRNLRTSISITIKAPAYINLDMENAYGDLFIQEVSGLLLLDLSYCNLKAGILSRRNEKPNNQMDLAYSNGTIDEAGWLEMELAYSEMEINSSDMLFMQSKYSKLMGESAGGIVTEGAYDKYFFDEIESFEAELKYSGLRFGILRKSLDVNASYTNVKIDKLLKGFDHVDAALSYGNVSIDVEDGASFKLEGESKYGKINVASEGRLSRTKEGSMMRVWGSVGSGSRSDIHLITRYGNIDLE